MGTTRGPHASRGPHGARTPRGAATEPHGGHTGPGSDAGTQSRSSTVSPATALRLLSRGRFHILKSAEDPQTASVYMGVYLLILTLLDIKIEK